MNGKNGVGFQGYDSAVKIRDKVSINLDGIVIRFDKKTGRITNPKTVGIQFNRAAAGLINDKSNRLIPEHVSENTNLTTAFKDRAKKPLNFEQVENLDLERIEFWVIMEALERTRFVQAHAAGLLGMTPRGLNYKIKTYGIQHPSWKKNKP